MSSNFKKFSLLIVFLVAAILSGCISEDTEPSEKMPADDIAVNASQSNDDIQDARDSQAESLPINGTGNGLKKYANNGSDVISVATTISPLAGLISLIGGDNVEIATIIPPGAEPHTYEPTPSQMKEIANADIYIMNGAGLEFWMEKALLVNEDMLVVDSSEGVELLSEEGGNADPHIWLSLQNAAIQVDNICNCLIQVDSANRDYYLRNKDALLEEMKALDREFSQTFAAKENKTFIVFHPAWSYLARDYGLVQVPIMEEEKEPGPQYLASLIDMAKKNDITTIFVDPQFNPKSAEVIAREMNATIVVLDPLADDYLQNMRRTGEEISKSLK